MLTMSTTSHDLSPAQAAALIGVHPETLKRWADRGLIPSLTTPGGWRRFNRADVDCFIAAGRSATSKGR